MKNQTLGMMIASLRKEHGMTQLELAEKMHVTDKAVSKWERDLCCPDINSLPKLAEIFGLSVDELMQVKSAAPEEETTAKVSAIITLILKAVALAMGIAVIVLSIFAKLDLHSGFILLGIGLTCAGIVLLQIDTPSKR